MDAYEQLECVGKGNQGSVYRVRHRVSGTVYVLKRAELDADDDSLRAAALKEAETLGSLQHACVVRYVESFVQREGERTFMCIVMEYCAGGDLHRRVEQAAALVSKGLGANSGAGGAPAGFFPEAQVLVWFVQIALALHHVHVRRLLHRDLKTQNIFVASDGSLKLGDFGIARMLDGPSKLARTMVGTPYYMSPELFQNVPYGFASDVWALGCVLYELLSLRHAFDGRSINGLAANILRGKYPPLPPHYSRSIRDLVGEMLAREPERRPPVSAILSRLFLKRHIGAFATAALGRAGLGGSTAEGLGALRAQLLSAGMLRLVEQVEAQRDAAARGDDTLNPAVRAEGGDADGGGGGARKRQQLVQQLSAQEAERLRIEAAIHKLNAERAGRRAKRREKLLPLADDAAAAAAASAAPGSGRILADMGLGAAPRAPPPTRRPPSDAHGKPALVRRASVPEPAAGPQPLLLPQPVPPPHPREAQQAGPARRQTNSRPASPTPRVMGPGLSGGERAALDDARVEGSACRAAELEPTARSRGASPPTGLNAKERVLWQRERRRAVDEANQRAALTLARAAYQQQRIRASVSTKLEYQPSSAALASHAAKSSMAAFGACAAASAAVAEPTEQPLQAAEQQSGADRAGVRLPVLAQAGAGRPSVLAGGAPCQPPSRPSSRPPSAGWASDRSSSSSKGQPPVERGRYQNHKLSAADRASAGERQAEGREALLRLQEELAQHTLSVSRSYTALRDAADEDDEEGEGDGLGGGWDTPRAAALGVDALASERACGLGEWSELAVLAPTEEDLADRIPRARRACTGLHFPETPTGPVAQWPVDVLSAGAEPPPFPELSSALNPAPIVSKPTSLATRVELLRAKCVEALGIDAFTRAHAFLTDKRGQGLRPGAPAWTQLEAIVGSERTDFCPVLEQLVFIEDLSRSQGPH